MATPLILAAAVDVIPGLSRNRAFPSSDGFEASHANAGKVQ
jgi:hypothetical protein